MQDKIHAMRGFRNIVVHRYGTIDDALAFSLLQENIGDFSCLPQKLKMNLVRFAAAKKRDTRQNSRTGIPDGYLSYSATRGLRSLNISRSAAMDDQPLTW